MNRKLAFIIGLLVLLASTSYVRFRSSEVKASNGLRVHNLDTGLNYTAIQDAISAPETLDGHKIFVEEGTYYEHVFVNKSVSLVGTNRSTTIIDGNGTGIVVYVTASHVLVKGFTTRNGGSEWPCSGVCLNESRSSTIVDNILTNTQYGLFLYRSNNTIATDNIIANCGWLGICFEFSLNNLLTRNMVTDNPWGGITLYFCSNSIVSDNQIMRTNYSIDLHYSSNNVVSGNSVTNDEDGIIVGRSANNNTISGNNITNTNHIGVVIWDSSNNNTVSGNNIANNHIGISVGVTYVGNCSYNTLSENDIIANDYGIEFQDSSNNSVYHNNFLNNLLNQATTVDSVNVWDYSGEGNYWSDYTFVDGNHDGISDSPHPIYENNQDNYPLMGIFFKFNTSLGYYVNVITNLTIGSFQFFESNSTIKMRVSNMTIDQTFGFCRTQIPHALMNVDNISVIIDSGLTAVIYQNYTLHDDGTYRWIYFAFEMSTHEVDIIPEFSSMLILLVFMMLIFLAVVVRRKRFA